MKDNVQVIMPPSRTVTANGKSTALLLRVCAYCRVSTDEDEQMHSIGEQKDEYENRIKNNPDWTFVGIYSDEGISGTDVKHRTQFMRMMQDARVGKIDLILTKSISRFGRNTMDTVNSVRELKKLGVYIKFETEGIYTKDDCEFILTMLASVAQEEARHISVNVKWNCEKRMREGIPILCHTTFLGYTKDAQTKKLIVVPEEAKIIQEIYGMYTAYVGPNEICRTMEKKGYKTGRSQSKWYLSYVQSILKNEKYCGDLLQQKSVTTDFLAHKRAKNINLAPKYYIKDDHEAIIPRDVWEKAQEIRKARAEQRQHGNKNIQRYLNRYPYSGLIMCGECGGPFKRRYWNYGFDCQRIVYQCSDRTSNRSTCKKANIDLIVLEKCTAEVIHKFMSSNEHVYDDIKEIVTDCYTIDQIEVTLRELQSEKDKLTESISKLIDLKLQSKIVLSLKSIIINKMNILLNYKRLILKSIN